MDNASAAVAVSERPLRRDQSALVEAHLAPLFQSDDPAIVAIAVSLRSEVRRSTSPDNGWDFSMIGLRENRAVVSHLRKESARPLVALEVWAVIIEHLQRDSSVIPLTRAQIAAEVGVSPANVSEVMSELFKFGAILRQRVPSSGVRGPGIVRYSVNPWFATRLPKGVRADEQAKVPRPKARAKLRAIEGGLSSERRSRASVVPPPVV